VLIAVQPRLLPGFAFAWLELASHRSLMPRLLQVCLGTKLVCLGSRWCV
jgi:hypothetical protein